MLIHESWQYKTTAAMTVLGFVATATMPFFAAQSTFAQVNRSSNRTLGSGENRRFERSQNFSSTVSAGTIIPVNYNDAERIIVAPTETAPFTLIVANDIFATDGTLAIPAGSLVEGDMRPAPGGGTYYVARELILREAIDIERRLPLNATSAAITQTTTVTRRTAPQIFRGAAIGAAAAAIISEIFGDIDWYEVLAGVGVGVIAELLIQESETVEVIVVKPEQDLDLRLQENLVFN